MIPGETVLTGGKHPGTELKLMYSPNGYYLGFEDKDGQPYSRETDYIGENTAILLLELIRK